MSRWNDLVNSNDAPLHSEMGAIQDVLQGARKALSALELDKLSSLIAPEAHRRRLHKQVALIRVCTTILSPSRRVPLEIIAEILFHATHRYSSSPSSASLDTSRGIWALSHVCSRWRQVAVSYPEFWTSMRIMTPRRIKNPPALVSTILERSKGLPLQGIFGPVDLNIAPILSDNCHLWTHLSFTCHSAIMLKRLNQVTQGFSALDSLELDIVSALSLHRRVYKTNPPAVTVFKDAPLLHRLTIKPSNDPMACALYDSFLEQFPWERITDYDGPDLPQKIQRLTSARSVYLWGFDPTSVNWPPATPARLPHLRDLRVEDVRKLACVVAPGLQHIEIGQPFGYQRLGTNTVLKFIHEQSQFSLTSLVTGCHLNFDEHLFSSLTTLHITATLYADYVIACVQPVSSSGSIILPNLESLTMDVDICRTWSGRRTANFEESIFGLMENRSAPKILRDADIGYVELRPLRKLHLSIGVCCQTTLETEYETLRHRLTQKDTELDIKISLFKSTSCLGAYVPCVEGGVMVPYGQRKRRELSLI